MLKRPHWHPPLCRKCGVGKAEGVTVSQTGLCPDCSLEAFEANLTQLRAKSGPYFEHWARRGLLAYHRQLVAARDPQP